MSRRAAFRDHHGEASTPTKTTTIARPKTLRSTSAWSQAKPPAPKRSPSPFRPPSLQRFRHTLHQVPKKPRSSTDTKTPSSSALASKRPSVPTTSKTGREKVEKSTLVETRKVSAAPRASSTGLRLATEGGGIPATAPDGGDGGWVFEVAAKDVGRGADGADCGAEVLAKAIVFDSSEL